MRTETLVIGAFVLVIAFYVALLFGPTAIGGMLIAIGLGLCFWLVLVLLLSYDLVFWSLLFVDFRGLPVRIIVLSTLVGLGLIAAGVLLIALDAPSGGRRIVPP